MVKVKLSKNIEKMKHSYILQLYCVVELISILKTIAMTVRCSLNCIIFRKL